jgi:hypothetical protein
VAFGLQNGQNGFLLESSYFCYLGAHAKIWNPTITPSGVLATAVTRRTRRTRDEKIWKIVAYGCQTLSAQRRSDQDLFMQNSGHLSADRWCTHYARTNLKPYDNPFWDIINGSRKKKRKKAGTELCQAQFKLGLAMPTSWVSCLAKLPT